ncbi:MAG: hypothetical protein AAGG48_29660 [Planctomycetota bacterium]
MGRRNQATFTLLSCKTLGLSLAEAAHFFDTSLLNEQFVAALPDPAGQVFQLYLR